MCDDECSQCGKPYSPETSELISGGIAELFTCPDCGRHRLEEVMENVVVTTVLEGIGEDGDVDYGEQSNEHGYVVRYQCVDCGHELVDEDGDHIVDAETLWAYLKQQQHKGVA